MRPVHIGCIEEVDTKFQRTVNCGYRFRVVSAGIELAHSHASEPDGGNHRTVTAKSSCLHISELSSLPRQAAGRLCASRLHMSSEIENVPPLFQNQAGLLPITNRGSPEHQRLAHVLRTVRGRSEE